MSGASVSLSIDDRARNSAHWPLLRDLIRSGQVPEARIESLYRDHPLFATWMRNAAATGRQPEPKP